MTYGQFTKEETETLSSEYSQEEARALAVRLLSSKLNIPEYKYISEPDSRISPARIPELQQAVEDLAKCRPVQYVIGSTEFAGYRIRVKEGVLIPRPETEELFQIVADSIPEDIDEEVEFNILDICTGSGCLAYSLAASFPGAGVYGCDISNDALKIASKQRIENAHPVLFWADVLGDIPCGLPKFDIIVSNPPYVRESEKALMRRNVLDYEPSLALFVPDDDPLVFYRAIARWAEFLLKPDGHVFLEINEAYGKEVSELFPGSEIRKDFLGKDRFVIR